MSETCVMTEWGPGSGGGCVVTTVRGEAGRLQEWYLSGDCVESYIYTLYTYILLFKYFPISVYKFQKQK